jgi:AcrR family transcriptional regulator
MNKKESVINAALKLFVENGFHGTATAKIAQEAGVANGTLFQYFKTKEELIIALFIQIKDEMADAIVKNTTNMDDVKQSMKSQILSSLNWAMDHPIKFHFIQQFHTSPYMNQVKQEVIDKYLEPQFTLIEKGKKKGIVKSLPIDLIYALISNQTFGLYQFITAKKLSKPKREETIDMTFDMLWEMLARNLKK